MVRALLATFGLEIVGDTRYGTLLTVGPPVPFVALHACSILLPTVFELGNHLEQPRLFTASLPLEWTSVFQLQEDHLAVIEKESNQYPYIVY
jgi:hypothetical protein